MQTAFQILLTALQIGAIYVLFSLGLTLIFGVMRVVNFAHGQFFTLAALLVAVIDPWFAARGFSGPLAYVAAVGAGIAAAILLGAVVYRFGFKYFQRDLTGSFILSVGLVLLCEGVFLDVFGGSVRVVPPIVKGDVQLFGSAIAAQRLVLGGVAVVCTVLLYVLLATTRFGKAMRAVAIDHEAAMLQGIPCERIAFQGFLLATTLGAVAGAIIAPISAVTPVVGADYLVKGFIAVIIGGLGSVPGAIVGSLFIALVESVGGFLYDPSIANMAIFVLVMIVLMVRPNGLLGRG